MTLKVIAVGILALLALSSVMNSKASRGFLGGGAVLVLVLFVAYAVFEERQAGNTNGVSSAATAKREPTWRKLLPKQPNFIETAEHTARQILADINREIKTSAKSIDSHVAAADSARQNTTAPRNDPPAGAPTRSRRVLIERFSIKPYSTDESDDQKRADMVAKLRMVVDAYLERFRADNKGLGVDQLRAEHLNLNLLRDKIVLLRDRNGNFMLNEKGQKQVRVIFVDRFDDHVRRRGREIVMRQRLTFATYVSAAVGALMCMLFGALKLLNARQRQVPERDHLRLSHVSMM